ncbi:hypothetical protein GBA63_14855 [Rubrobacter tropicus]|uniref:Uncharacterized protein n=1 Tax=Rubrobacter tropicus TaxID=2653851 RepID=A0A6G8QBA8_9ACTN|nr:hypothetical protein [Rubrobacter tropicus]QIN83770.1 hypothetical protein GBA63_14855 [Rubrobacter tropicus]
MESQHERLNALYSEATQVLLDCTGNLEAAEELVDGIPDRRAALERRLAPLLKRRDEAYEELERVRLKRYSEDDYDYVSPEERVAEDTYQRARSDAYHASMGTGGDDFDLENRKAVARQLASLVREDSERRLEAIAKRGGDPELRKYVAGCKDEVFRSTYRLMRRFAEARSLLHEEVRTTRAEANNIFDRLKNPPVEQ